MQRCVGLICSICRETQQANRVFIHEKHTRSSSTKPQCDVECGALKYRRQKGSPPVNAVDDEANQSLDSELGS